MTHKERAREVREILALDTDEVIKRAKGQLIAFDTLDEVYDYLAEEMVKAFNEPGPGVAESNPRILEINDFTRTIDSTRHPGVGGNLENFPRRAITMGMKQCIEARKILIMTRNESPFLNWANTIIRIAALGKPGDDYPVTHMRHHRNLRIVTDRNTLKKPRFNI